MGDDGFERVDMAELIRRQRRRAAIDTAGEDREPVMKAQARSQERVSRRGTPHGHIERGEVDGQPAWTLHGAPVLDGAVLEVYTNRANGWVKGQVAGAAYGRPRLLITLWNPWGERDADGLPPQVGKFEVPLPEGAMCRWSAALPQEID